MAEGSSICRLILELIFLVAVNSALTSAQTPQNFIFTFPEVRPPSHFYHRQTLVTGHNVTVKTQCDNSSSSETVINTRTPAQECTESGEMQQPSYFQEQPFPSASTVTMKTDDLVAVYAYQFFKNDASTVSFLDAVLVKPDTQLGRRYVVVTPPTQRAQPSGLQGVAFLHVTASQDDTHVNIGLKNGECEGLSGEANTTLVHRLTTTSCSANGTDLTGVVIDSDKPVAVSSGIVRGSVEGCDDSHLDHLWTVLPAVETWGPEYLTFPTPGMADSDPPDIYHIVASEDQTMVRIDDTINMNLTKAFSWIALNTHHMSEGVQTEQTVLDNRFHHLIASKPIMVVKTTRQHPCGACMLALTDTYGLATTLTFALPDTSEWRGAQEHTFYMTVITLTNEKDDVTLNGRNVNEGNIQINWTQVNPFLVGGHLTVSTSDDVFVLSSASGTSRLFAYVTGGGESYKLCTAVGEGVASMADEWTTARSYTSHSPTHETTATNMVTSTATNTATSSDTYTDTNTNTDTATSTDTYTDTNTDTATSTVRNTDTNTDTATSTDTNTATSAATNTDTSAATTTVTNMDISTAASVTEEPISSTTSSSLATAEDSTSVSPAQQASTETDGSRGNLTQTDTGRPRFTTSCAAGVLKPAQNSQGCRCVKEELRSAETKEEKEAADAATADLKSSLTVPTHNLSATVRRVTSAPDDRTSSVVMGSTATICVSLMLGLPVLFDVVNLVSWLIGRKLGRRVSAGKSAATDDKK